MGKKIILVTVALVLIIAMAIIIFLHFRKRKNKLKNRIEELDREKNIIESAPVLAELAKLETIIKNEKMEEKYNNWQKRFEDIKDNNIELINDMIIDIDVSAGKEDYKDRVLKVAQIEIEIAKAKHLTNSLLDEIKAITLSEEKYRSIIIKLKTRYRELKSAFEIHKVDYGEIADIIELQFENIEKRFQDFEEYMEKNEYDEVVHIVKAIDSMVDHIGIVVSEVPDLVLLSTKLIPKRIEQINNTYQDMVGKDYPLDYLQIPYNIEETTKNVKNIFDRIKVLNLEDCMFELRTILEYLDSLFGDFEKERNSRRKFEEDKVIFESKLDKINNVVSDIYNQLDEIKSLYDLKDEDIIIIDDVNLKLIELNKDYKNKLKDLKKHKLSYVTILNDLDVINNRLKSIDEELDKALKSLGNMYDDEVRAHEQLEEIQEFLKTSKDAIRSYKLPVISDHYYVQLSEANDAIEEVVKELDKKPIVIKTLNTRVDTARDLVLKLYNTTMEMIHTAQYAEMAMIYGNRYRQNFEEVDKALMDAEKAYYKGNYKESLDVAIKVMSVVDENIYRKLMGVYEK